MTQLVVAVLSLMLLACGGGSTSSNKVAPAAPVITTFTAAQDPITAGTSTMLTATFTGGTGVIDKGVGTVASGIPIGSGNISSDTTFTLTVSGEGGTTTRTQTVHAVPAPIAPVVTAPSLVMAGKAGYTASAAPLVPGLTYNWIASGGTITAGNNTAQIVFTAGAVGTLQLACTTTNAVGATSERGNTIIEVQPAPVISGFQASPAAIASGQSTTLSWSVSPGTSLSIDQGIGVVTGLTSWTVSPAVSTTYTLTATNAAGSVTATATAYLIGQKPIISSFAATPATISTGQTTTLSWAVNGATTISIDQGVGPVTGTTVTLSPTTTTTYTLTASNPGGSVTATALVTVNAVKPTISSFTATPSTITAGASSVLAWSVTGATSLSISPTVGTVTGTTVGVIPSASTVYTLTATNAAGSSTATVSVTVSGQKPTIASFTATPLAITTGQSSALSWSVSGATSLSIDQAVGTVTGTTVSVTPSATTIYTLTAVNAAGSSTATVTVTVSIPKPAISSFTALPVAISSGQSSVLSWAVGGATSLSISPTVGTVTGTSVSVTPTTTTIYTLTATNAGGSSTATVTVTLTPPKPTITSFTASPTSISPGQTSTLSWVVSGATSLSIDQGVGTISGTSVSVSPAASATYLLTATNAGGSTTATVTISVAGSRPAITGFTANPATIITGQGSTLSWAVSGATSLSIDQGVGVVTGTSKSVAPTTTTTYTLTATNGAGSSSATTTITVLMTTAIFDPTTGALPLPNLLVTSSLTSVTYTAAATPTAGALNINPGYPLTPDKALAYVNLKEMGSTHAVSGLNAPIYIQFSAAVDATTLTSANIKVFQLTPDAAGTENNALGFTDISGLFTYSPFALTPATSGSAVYLMPIVPLLPGYRYLYVLTSRVKDTAGLSVSPTPYFEALKSSTALTGSFAGLEAIRSDLLSGTNILLSGYAKVMNDLIAASATTTVVTRADIVLMGRFITTGAGYISTDPANTTPALAAVRYPVETALWAWANNAKIPNTADFSTTESRAWTNGISNFYTLGSSVSPATITAIFGSIPSSAVGFVGAGTFESGDLQLDPYAVNANLTNAAGKLDAVTSVYNPGTSTVPGSGVTQAFRNATGALRGFYHKTRTVPFIVITPLAAAPIGGYPVAIFMHGFGGQKEQALGLANTLCAAGYAVIAIDQAVHGLASGATGSLTSPLYTGPGMGNGRPATEWSSNFFMLPSVLTARSNGQTSAFNLWRLERILKQPSSDTTSLQSAMATAGKPLSPPGATQFVGQGLGSIVGAYFLAGNSSQTGGSNMKGLLSVPGGKVISILKDSPSFTPSVNSSLAGAGISTGTAAYYQFFALAQAVLDPVDPASMGAPLPGQTASRLAGRILVQEAVGDSIIPNACGQYFVNAFAGRQGQLGSDASGGFAQVNRAGQIAPAVPYVYGATLSAIKASVAAATATGTANPAQGVMQYGTTATPAAHGLLLADNTTPANVAASQRQMALWMYLGIVADGGATTNGYPLAPTGTGLTGTPGLFGPESLVINYPAPLQE